MAVALHDLQRLVARGDNDNRAGEPGGIVERPPKDLQVRPGLLELDYPNLATRLEAETKILWAYMRHPDRACFTPDLMNEARHFQTWLRGAFAGCGRHELPFRHLVWASRAPAAW